MSEILFDAFETCLQALEKGETLDASLARFPGLAAELRPMIEASFHARALDGSPVSHEVQRLGRLRLLQHAAEMRKTRRGPRRTWLYNFRPLAVSFMLVIFFLSSTGLVHASSGALPGDNLYPVKRTWEGMRLFFTFADKERENLEMEYENERLEEADDLLAEGRAESITFSGYITAQSEVQWMVSGLAVSINPQTILPHQPVTVGSGVIVHGMTTLDGYVDAQRIEIVPPGMAIPTPKPEMEGEDKGNTPSQEMESTTPSETESGEDSSPKEKLKPESTKEPESGGENEPPENQE